jgi:hypothetical protein
MLFFITVVAYLGAVVSSCSIAVGLGHWLKNANVSATRRMLLSKAVPFTAVAAAGSLNVFLMRRKELVYICIT